MNKKALVQFISEENEIQYAKGQFRIASTTGLKNGHDFELVNNNNVVGFKNEDILSVKYFDNDVLKEYTVLNEGKNKPTNPSLWSKAKSLAKSKFKVYPSAYANGWASKWYKKHGGGWHSVNESTEHDPKIINKIKPTMMQMLKPKLQEEIVNAHHAGTMTKKEIKSRDKTAKKVKAKPIKGNDTEENARYRLATYIELRKRGQEPKGKAPKKGKNKKKKDEGKK